MMRKMELESEAKKHQEQQHNAVMDAKRAAAVVAGGSSATASTTNETIEPITSVQEAWAAAKRQMGMN